jgi:hypothetical protein
VNDCQLPTNIPSYQPPRPHVPAVLPKDLEKLSKPHGILQKVVGRMLKMPKLSPLKMMSMKKVPKPISKQKKKKIV